MAFSYDKLWNENYSLAILFFGLAICFFGVIVYLFMNYRRLLGEIKNKEKLENELLPKNMNNTLGERAEKSLEFKEMLERRTGLPVVMWDERLTTVEANRALMEGGGIVD